MNDVKYTIGTHKTHLSDDQRKKHIDILNELIPYQSGRDYRYLKMTKKHLHKKYLDICTERNISPVSKSFVWTNLLKDEKIWRSNDEIACPHCLKFKELEGKLSLTANEQRDLIKLQSHKKNLVDQFTRYFKAKTDLLENEVMIVQDFSQLQCQKDSYQDLIITIYQKKDGQLEHQFLHFVAKSKNNNSFVIQAYKSILEHPFFANKTKVLIWSDGCGRHFKNSMMMVFWLELMKMKNFKIEINFFESYHGNNACDAASSHVKKKLNEHQRNTESILTDSYQISQIISLVKNHTGSQGPTDCTGTVKIETMTGIKSFYKFIPKFENNRNSIQAFMSSNDTTPQKIYVPVSSQVNEVKAFIETSWE